MVQKLPSACIVDIVAPTFAGIANTTAQNNGSVLVDWLTATDLSTPLTYEVYCLPGSVVAAVLFAANPTAKTSSLSEYIFRDSNGALLVAGTYTFGVRVRDAVGNRDSNLIVQTEVSSGVLTDSLAQIAASLNSTQLDLAQDVTDLDAIELALAADAASIAASESALAADIVDLDQIVADSQTVLESLSSAGGTALTGSLQTETVLDVDLIESV